jgi:hypothetical protein
MLRCERRFLMDKHRKTQLDSPIVGKVAHAGERGRLLIFSSWLFVGTVTYMIMGCLSRRRDEVQTVKVLTVIDHLDHRT